MYVYISTLTGSLQSELGVRRKSAVVRGAHYQLRASGQWEGRV